MKLISSQNRAGSRELFYFKEVDMDKDFNEKKYSLKDFFIMCLNYDNETGKYPEHRYEGVSVFMDSGGYALDDSIQNKINELKTELWDGDISIQNIIDKVNEL
jgi:hypothetical protein